MFKDKKIIIIGSIAYLLCLYVTFILYSPKFSVGAVKQALQQKNVEGLEHYIDFSSIQHGVKVQLKNELILKASEHKQQFNEPYSLSVAKVSYAIKMVEDFVGLFLSAKGLSRLFELGESHLQSGSTLNVSKYVSNLQSESFINDDEFEFKSFNSIEIKGHNLNGKQHNLIFTFRYTRWVLTDILVDLRGVDSKKVIDFIEAFQKA